MADPFADCEEIGHPLTHLSEGRHHCACGKRQVSPDDTIAQIRFRHRNSGDTLAEWIRLASMTGEEYLANDVVTAMKGMPDMRGHR